MSGHRNSAEAEFQAALKFCERPDSRVRFKFRGGDWREANGPAFLAELKGNSSGGVQIDSVHKVVGEG